MTFDLLFLFVQISSYVRVVKRSSCERFLSQLSLTKQRSLEDDLNALNVYLEHYVQSFWIRIAFIMFTFCIIHKSEFWWLLEKIWIQILTILSSIANDDEKNSLSTITKPIYLFRHVPKTIPCSLLQWFAYLLIAYKYLIFVKEFKRCGWDFLLSRISSFNIYCILFLTKTATDLLNMKLAN